MKFLKREILSDRFQWIVYIIWSYFFLRKIEVKYGNHVAVWIRMNQHVVLIWYALIPVNIIVGSLSSSTSSTMSSTTVSFDNISRHACVITRYWDYWKASCGWPGKAPVANLVQTCTIDGITLIDINIQFGCYDGISFTCNNQQSCSVNDSLAYGYAGVRITARNSVHF
jgi:hypothetical protein